MKTRKTTEEKIEELKKQEQNTREKRIMLEQQKKRKERIEKSKSMSHIMVSFEKSLLHYIITKNPKSLPILVDYYLKEINSKDNNKGVMEKVKLCKDDFVKYLCINDDEIKQKVLSLINNCPVDNH